MSKQDWFRKRTWSTNDREDFFAHLARARRRNKAQYLTIQAITLSSVRTPEAIDAAIHLIELMLAEYHERAEFASAYETMGECFEALGRVDDTLRAYRASTQAQRDYPGRHTGVAFRFGVFVVRNNLVDLYPEALAALDGEARYLMFPIEHYYYNAIRAIIAEHFGELESARDYAEKAVAASERDYSGLVRHPKVGLVKHPVPEIIARLRQIRGGNP